MLLHEMMLGDANTFSQSEITLKTGSVLEYPEGTHTAGSSGQKHPGKQVSAVFRLKRRFHVKVSFYICCSPFLSALQEQAS